METKARPRVVVVGGSFAGLAAVRNLHRVAEVTLVEPKEYFEYTPGVLHALVGSSGAESIITTPLEECIGGATHLEGYFQGLNALKKSALVQHLDGSLVELEYDFVIVATGRSYAAPIRPSYAALTTKHRTQELEQLRAALRAAKAVTVRGGGLVGVELAAELATRLHPRPAIRLLSRSGLLAGLPAKAGVLAGDWFKRHGVEVVYGQEDGDVKEGDREGDNEGEEELTIDCTGRTGITWASPSSFKLLLPNIKDEKGAAVGEADAAQGQAGGTPKKRRIRRVITRIPGFKSPYDSDGYVVVDPYLRSAVFNSGDVFAAGDTVRHADPVGAGMATSRASFGAPMGLPALRNANLAESQAKAIASVIARSGSLHGVQPYPHMAFGSSITPALACVSLGPRAGILVLDNLVLGGLFFSTLAAIAKFSIERTKVSEIRRQKTGTLFWLVIHAMVNALHRWFVRVRRFCIVIYSFLLRCGSNPKLA